MHFIGENDMGHISIKETQLKSVYEIGSYIASDDRGSINKFFSQDDLLAKGIEFTPVEEIVIMSDKGTMRGLHFQKDMCTPRILTCLNGQVITVILDIDTKSKSLGKWTKIVLHPMKSIYIPGTYAIGTLALEKSLILVSYGNACLQEYSRGIRWDDEELNIGWPKVERVIVSMKDQHLPTLAEYINNPC